RRGDVKGAGSHSAAAMEHAGYHEEPQEVACGITHALHHLVIILDGHPRVELRVGPAEIHDEFTATLPECREIGVVGIDDLMQEFQAWDVFVDIETRDRLLGIDLRHRHVAEKTLGIVGPDAAAVGPSDLLAKPAALAVRSEDFRADGPAGKEPFALASDVA